MIYIYDIYNGILAIKNNETMLYEATWRDLEIIILSEVRQKRTNIWLYLHVESKKMVQKELIYETDIDLQI